MRLGTTSKITGPVVGLSLLLLLVGSSAAWQVHRLQLRNSETLLLDVIAFGVADELESAIGDTGNELNRYLISGNAARLHAALGQRETVERALAGTERSAVAEEERRHVAEARLLLDDLFAELEEIVAAPEPPEDATIAQLRDILRDEAKPRARAYIEFNEQELLASNQRNQAISDRLVLALLLLGTSGAIAGLVAGYGVARGISRSIFQLSIPIRDVAGKLNEAVGPISVSADPGLDDLETVLQSVVGEVTSVIEQLQASHREVMRADQLVAVGQFAAGLAHELRNPLMCMKVLVQSARHNGPNRLDERDLEVLDEEISRLERLLQGFLDFARPAKLERRPIDLRHVVERTVDLLAARAERRRIAIAVALPEQPVAVDADESQLRQVLLNLGLNALDAVSNHGRIEITVAEGEADDAGNTNESWRIVRVADDGPGLPPSEARQRIFEPFFSTKETGLGMGLAVCQRIVESHGGTLTAEPSAAGGAMFTVRLLASMQDAEEPSAGPPPALQPAFDGAPPD